LDQKATRWKILIVDDEPDMRIFLSTLVEAGGYKPIAVGNIREGMKKALKEKPAIILLDMMMSGEGGIHMYRNLKLNKGLRKVPVIMLSTIDKETFFRCHKIYGQHTDEAPFECDIYMENPPDADELIENIRKSLPPVSQTKSG